MTPVLALASIDMHGLIAAVLVGGGLSLSVVAWLLRNRTKQRTLAAILDDTMGQAPVPLEVSSEAPPRGEMSAFTVRLGKVVGRFDNRGKLEQRLEQGAIPFRSGEYLVMVGAMAVVAGLAFGVLSGRPIAGLIGVVLVVIGAAQLPASRGKKRMKELQSQLPDALSLMAASVEGGHTFQRSIDMYRRDARAPISEELDRVMAEVAVGSELIVALENMSDRTGIEDLKWAVEAVRIQQSTGGRLAPILHTLAEFMRMRQEVRREVTTLTAEGRISGYVLFAIPIFVACAVEVVDPKYLSPMFHGAGLMALIFTAVLMAVGWLTIRRMVNIKV
jgi:tight adherence protein B